MPNELAPITRRGLLTGALASTLATMLPPAPAEALERLPERGRGNPVQLAGWEFAVHDRLEDLRQWGAAYPEKVLVGRDIEVTLNFNVHRDHIQAAREALARRIGQVGSYRLRQGGTELSGLGLLRSVTWDESVEPDALPDGADPRDWVRVQAGLWGVDSSMVTTTLEFGEIDLYEDTRRAQRQRVLTAALG